METIVRTYRDIRKEYEFDPSVMNDEPDRIRRAKQAVAGLNQVDRIIFLLYTDCLSYRKLGKRLGLSHMTVRKEVLRIRKQILDAYAAAR